MYQTTIKLFYIVVDLLRTQGSSYHAVDRYSLRTWQLALTDTHSMHSCRHVLILKPSKLTMKCCLHESNWTAAFHGLLGNWLGNASLDESSCHVNDALLPWMYLEAQLLLHLQHGVVLTEICSLSF